MPTKNNTYFIKMSYLSKNTVTDRKYRHIYTILYRFGKMKLSVIISYSYKSRARCRFGRNQSQKFFAGGLQTCMQLALLSTGDGDFSVADRDQILLI